LSDKENVSPPKQQKIIQPHVKIGKYAKKSEKITRGSFKDNPSKIFAF
jgi:hypothetical protein